MDLLINEFKNISTVLNDQLFFQFVIRLLIQIISTFILVRFIYYPNNKNANFLFVFLLMGITVFLIASILDSVIMEIGFAIGLFAIFGIIRFKTLSVEIKDMTYLFMVIGIAIINAVVESPISSVFVILVGNFTILGLAFFMEKYKPRKKYYKKKFSFTPSDYNVINDKEHLLEEIKQRFKIDIVNVELINVNAVKKEISVWIYFEMKQRTTSA